MSETIPAKLVEVAPPIGIGTGILALLAYATEPTFGVLPLAMAVFALYIVSFGLYYIFAPGVSRLE